MRVIFWQNIISPHQAPFMRKLVDFGHDVVVVATEAMSEDRRQLGWSAPPLGAAQIILGPDQSQVMQVVESSDAVTIHLIAGARGTSLGRQVALACGASGRRMGVITESPDARGLGGLLRWVKYSWERVSVGRHFNFILAMGERGVRWFKLCGYPESRIFPFGYVTDRRSGSAGMRADNGFRLVFVGQLIPRKGVDLLLQALARVSSVELSIIGDGPEKSRLQKLAQRCGISDRVRWLGKMSSAQAQALVADADVFVLPSREDGWGAVVNEALMVGTPVICSTSCGAADLIQHPSLGTVFQSGKVTDLAAAVRCWADKGKRSDGERERVRRWSQCIEAAPVARYVEQILAHVYERGVKPQTPWRIERPGGVLREITALAES